MCLQYLQKISIVTSMRCTALQELEKVSKEKEAQEQIRSSSLAQVQMSKLNIQLIQTRDVFEAAALLTRGVQKAIG